MINALLLLTPGFTVLLRIFLGASLLIHGYPKVKGGWRQSAQWMKSMGVPGITAAFATIIEFFGGILLIIGLLVPVVTFFVALQFVSIILVKKTKMNASYVSFSQNKPSYEIDVFYLAVALVIFFLGAGPASLDSLTGLSSLF